MKNALILHGTNFDNDNGLSGTNWFPWLGGKLTELGYDVRIPDLPKPSAPDLDRYWDYLKDFEFNEETVLIGHSSGATAILGLLTELNEEKIKINKAILVAGFSYDDGWNCSGLFKYEFDWKKIRESTKEIIQIHSIDDPYVSLENAKGIAENLGIAITLFMNKGHFSTGSSPEFVKFPEILDWI